jgi:gliding motility-associated protein GldM
VNKLDAFVIPEKTTLYPGEQFTAHIVMAAVDTTQQPEIYVNGTRINTSDGRYSFTAGGVGEHQFSGYLLTRNAAGETLRREFLQKYSVIPAPSGATVAADLMNVLYAGYQNPISVSVPGVPKNKVNATMSGGTLTKKGEGEYIATPSKVGEDVVITVTADNQGRSQEMGKFTFRVRKLPDPTAYIAYSDGQGGENRFKGGKLSKQVLMSVNSLGAAVDDGLLNIPFRVTGFETVSYDRMGNAFPEVSGSAEFTERQKSMFRGHTRGKRFFITRIKAIGPDGVERTLDGAMDVTVN